jgi:hypothetical protein
LDWTRSPFVATYFAVSGNFDQEGAVWAFDAMAVAESDNQPNKDRIRDTLGSNDNGDVFWRNSPEQFIHSFSLLKEHVRSVTQQGMFTVCGKLRTDHADVIEESLARIRPESCLKFIINPDVKRKRFADYLG